MSRNLNNYDLTNWDICNWISRNSNKMNIPVLNKNIKELKKALYSLENQLNRKTRSVTNVGCNG